MFSSSATPGPRWPTQIGLEQDRWWAEEYGGRTRRTVARFFRAGGCAGPRWPAAGPRIASPAGLRCARSRGGRSAHYAASCVPCYWARDCAVPCGRAPPLGRRRTRARVVRSQVACVGGCAVPARTGWGRGRVGAYVAGFRNGAAAAGIRGGGSRVGGRMLAGL